MKKKNYMEAKTQVEDWQKGNNSTLSPLTRIDYMNEWLKKNKQDILLKQVDKELKNLDKEEFLGFIDID